MESPGGSRARELAHPFSVAESLALPWSCGVRAVHSVRERAEAMISLATEHDFSHWRSHAMIYRGWALAMQGQGEEGLALLQQGLDAWRAMGGELARTFFLALLAEGYGAAGQVVAGLAALLRP